MIKSFTKGCVYNNLSWVSVNARTNLNHYYNNLSLQWMSADTDPVNTEWSKHIAHQIG